MDLSLSSTEQQLAASVRNFVEADVVDQVRAMSFDDPGVRPDWQLTMARAGWLGVTIPEEYGGGGATALEAAVIFEQLGRGPLPHLPLATAAAAAVLTSSAPEAWRSELLPGMADGATTCVVAGLDQLFSPGRDARGEVKLTRDGKWWRLDGAIPIVSFAGAADVVLVLVRDGSQWRLARVAQQSGVQETRPLAGFLAYGQQLSFAGVEIADDAVCTVQPDDLVRALYRPMVWTAAYAVGGCARSLEMSREYCERRVQFRQPIGRFQRVQDHVIRILNFTDQARWSLYDALWRIDDGRSAATSVHMAKAVSAEAYWESTNAAHEIHAGIGSDPQFGLVAYSRMSRTLYHFLGSPRWHKRRMIDEVVAVAAR